LESNVAVDEMRVTIAVLNKHGKPALANVIDALRSVQVEEPLLFSMASPTRVVDKKSVEVLCKQDVDSPALVGCAYSKQARKNYDFLSLEDATLLFEGRVYSPVPKAAIDAQAAKNPLHCEAQLQTLMAQADGDYAFLMVSKDWIAAGRDPVGVQPLYFGENRDISAFATNRKALWQLGIAEVKSFPPGNLAFAGKEGFKFKAVKQLVFAEPKPVSLEQASLTLQALLLQSIQRRLAGLSEVAVAFSGGLDSSVVAYLASKCGVKVNLVHVSLENQAETEEAIRASEVLGLPLSVHLFKESDVESVLPKVLSLIEEADPIKASIGVPFYWVAQKASEAGFRVLLAGQGADELFGGYQRYVNECCKDGAEKARRTMFDDVVRIHESNIERDEKICIFQDVELRLPFASFEIAEFALGLPAELKVENKPDSLRKMVLRKAASDLGLPVSIANKPKKAVQYSTGINDAVKRIAKKSGKTVNDYIAELFQNATKA
jgi:asparagine synthase (glutamine-hydrolysing)